MINLRAGGAILGRHFGRVPLPIHRKIAPRSIVSVVYHAASDERLSHIAPLHDYKTASQFMRDLEELGRRFRVVNYEDIPTGAPTNALLITADDGLAECFHVMRPALKNLGMSAAFFVVPGLLDNQHMTFRHKAALCLTALADRHDRIAVRSWLRRCGPEDEAEIDRLADLLGISFAEYLRKERPYLTTDEVLTLSAEGFTVGAHSLTHRRLDVLSYSEAADEIVNSCSKIAALTGRSSVPFAFPYGAARFPPGWLNELRRQFPVVGHLFGTKGVLQHDELLNRVFADPPGVPAHRAIGMAYASNILRISARKILSNSGRDG